MTPGMVKGEPAPPNGECVGRCKGDRAVYEGPAKFAHTHDGRKVIWCPCCGHELREIPAGADAPNLIAVIDQRQRRRFTDDTCGYNVEVLPELRERR